MKSLSEIEKFLCNQTSQLGDILESKCPELKALEDSLPPEFRKKFSVVNGINCPNGAMVCGQDGCDKFSLPNITQQREAVRKIILSQTDRPYTNGRKLDGHESYNSELGLNNGGIQKLLENHSNGKDISIADFGCGIGLADKQMSALPFVENVSAITLPFAGEIYWDEIFFANSLNLHPIEKFDASISIHGFTCYNPYKEAYHGLHSATRLINATKIGGLYLDSEGTAKKNGNNKYNLMLKMLVREGILEQYTLSISLATKDLPPVFKVKNHLTIQKILSLANKFA